MSKALYLGDEAIAQGALDAGLSGVYAYPGTPSTEITEYIQGSPLASERGVHSEWCTNEKTAMEAALGMSYAGRRALVCMKHVGMNVCADAFVNAAMTGVNGGLLVVAADDPSMHSSQNEQDSRFYGAFALTVTLEPHDQQQCYDMAREAFDLSEHLRLPVLLRLVTRLAHSRSSVVTVDTPREVNPLHLPDDPRGFVLLPAIARRKNEALTAEQPRLRERSESSRHNHLTLVEGSTMGVIHCGLAQNYVEEAGVTSMDMLHIGQYPVPVDLVRRLCERNRRVLVVEDGQPFVEAQLRGLLNSGVEVAGRLTGELPRTGELTPDNVRAALQLPPLEHQPAAHTLAPRPPALCQGCGHRDVYQALREVVDTDFPDAQVFGDIGCYTLGALPPFSAINSCVDMGASITMAKGATDAGLRHVVAVIGDSTFTHSGMTGLLDAINADSPFTLIISDNLTTAMTGGQHSPGLNKYEAICLGLGLPRERLFVVEPLPKNIPAIKDLLRTEMQREGLSVIIPRRECLQTLRRKKKA